METPTYTVEQHSERVNTRPGASRIVWRVYRDSAKGRKPIAKYRSKTGADRVCEALNQSAPEETG